MSTERANPFAGLDDLSDFAEPKPAARAPFPVEAIREASEKQGFVSRAAARPAAAPSSPPAEKLRRARRQSNDTQINIKCRQTLAERFITVADRLGWAYADVLDAALDALEKETKKGSLRPRRS